MVACEVAMVARKARAYNVATARAATPMRTAMAVLGAAMQRAVAQPQAMIVVVEVAL